MAYWKYCWKVEMFQRAVIGLCRDIRGVAISCHTKMVYAMLFDWLLVVLTDFFLYISVHDGNGGRIDGVMWQGLWGFNFIHHCFWQSSSFKKIRLA